MLFYGSKSFIALVTDGANLLLLPFYRSPPNCYFYCKISVINFFEQNTLPVYGAFMEGESVSTIKIERPSLLIIGNEGKGIDENLNTFITKKISVNRIGKAESLNAAIATAIICDRFLN